MSKHRRIACTALVVAFLVGGFAPTRSEAAHYSNPVVYWNGVAADTALADKDIKGAAVAALYVAIAQAAVYNATMAIEKTHAMYHSSLSAPPGASLDAAIATAAHDVLVEYFPAQRDSSLDPKYDATMDEIDDDDARDDGVAVGAAAADEMIELRADDGRFADVPEPPEGDEPGEWRHTAGPAAITPWVASVTPFLVNSPDQFRPVGPNSVTSTEYATQWDEVRRLGAKVTKDRDEKQTEIARFWSDNPVGQYNRAFQRFALERALPVGETARLFAMTSLTGADAMITCWNTKFHYLFWRPITAIKLADTDGNPATTAPPTDWVPFSTTANHPEYTSGHACLTGAVTRSLETFLGTANIDMKMDSAMPMTTEHTFNTVDELCREVENARIYGGDHFRKGGTDGTKAGDHVAKWALKRFFGAV